MNVKKVRKNFNLLKDKNFIYFDNAAMALRPKAVVDKVSYYNNNYSFNIGRAVYKKAYETTSLVEKTRERVATFINANAEEVVFTKNTTDGLNLVAKSFGELVLQEGDEIITSVLEHHSSLLPWVEMAKKVNAKIVYVPLNKNNKITVENFKKVLSKKTKIVALTYVSNVMGYITPLKQIIDLAHKHGAFVVVDAAQAITHFKIDVKQLDCDFLCWSGYKLGASTGVGVMFGKGEHLQKMQPTNFGGGAVLSVAADSIELKSHPEKFEAGTQAITEILSLNETLTFLEKIGFEYIVKTDFELRDYLLQQLAQIKEIEVYNKHTDIALIAFNIKGIHSHDAATMYSDLGVSLRAGHHCCQPLIEHLKQVSVLRVSLYYYNTKAEIDKFIEATYKIINFFEKFN